MLVEKSRLSDEGTMVAIGPDGTQYTLPPGTVVNKPPAGSGFTWFLRASDGRIVPGPAKPDGDWVMAQAAKHGGFRKLGNRSMRDGSAAAKLAVFRFFAGQYPDVPEVQAAADRWAAEMEVNKQNAIDKPERKRQQKLRDQMEVGASIAAATLQAQAEMKERDQAEPEDAEEKPDEQPRRRGRPPKESAE